jgi:outer membrane protein TolC
VGEAAPALPAQWHTESATPSEGKSPSAGWDFGSEELRRLLAEAEAASLDVAAAVARVRQAEAAARIAGAPLLPEVTAGMEAGRQGNYHQRPSSGFDAGGVPVNIALFRRLTHNAVTIFHA